MAVTDEKNITTEVIAEHTYTGNTITPEVTVKNGTRKLIKDIDFTVRYDNNTNAGTATVLIRGINNYTGVTKNGSGVSEGCFLIDRNKWNDFINLFLNSSKQSVVGVILQRK